MNYKKRSEALYIANDQRQQIAEGVKLQYKNQLFDVSPASNMYKLTYSFKLEKKAIAKVKTCNTDLPLGYTYYIRDVSVDRPNDPPPSYSTDIPNAMFEWFEMFYDTQTTYTGTEFGQFFYAKASQIGCAQQNCKEVTGRWRNKLNELNITFSNSNYPFVVCAYDKKLTFGKSVYKKGKKLKCPKGSKPNKKHHVCDVKGRKRMHK
ncbi:hypothetical protein M3Y97_00949000 [Aphelenchoides bicaudatus]|nr:hypothetical protein M3Y97_00949000 [Aphelenchoides bicaudatus]